MFNPTNPPFITLPITPTEAKMFSKHEGYNAHEVSADLTLVSFQEGWTLPLSAQEKKLVIEEPLLLLRNTGKITSEGSSFARGFAHQFCKMNGDDLPKNLVKVVFPDRKDENWMLVPESAAVVWLQYSYKTEYLGESGHDSETYYYGKLLISTLAVQRDSVPRLDKNADNLGLRAIQYRVEEKVLISREWTTTDEDPQGYLMDILSSHDLDHYKAPLAQAITVATSH